MKDSVHEAAPRPPYQRRPPIGPYPSLGQRKLDDLINRRLLLQREVAAQIGVREPRLSLLRRAYARATLAEILRIVEWSKENGIPSILHEDWLLDSERGEG